MDTNIRQVKNSLGKDGEGEGDKRPLTLVEINDRLADFPGWTFEKDEIFKMFEFPTFMEAVGFVDELAPICEKMGHHPDILIYYKKIQFRLQRYHSGQKVTEIDFKSAREIENLYDDKYQGSAKQSLCSV